VNESNFEDGVARYEGRQTGCSESSAVLGYKSHEINTIID